MKYKKYRPPTTIAEAKARKRALEAEIADISAQLKDTMRFDKEHNLIEGDALEEWREKARRSQLYKQLEQVYLKDWIADRRRKVLNNEVGIFESDALEYLQRARLVLRRILDGDSPKDAQAGETFNVIEQYLLHEG